MHATGKHSEPVWGVKWVSKEADKKQQNLVSISTDGSVQQWATKKGLVPHQLMQLKRIPNKEQLVSSHMEGISREASGLCFDFPVDDCTQYFAGTEGGIIHKCSVSYNEQTLENYFGHTGPVYKVKASPFCSDAFLSCSADWTCALWSQKKTSPVQRFQSGHDYMMDIDWSPVNSCVFGAVSRDGRVEVWDLKTSQLDPVIKHVPEGEEKELSCVLFAPNAPGVLTGANDGSIDVYRIYMKGIDSNNNWSLQQQSERLGEVLAEAD
jgi:WD40 repeat protein